MLTTVASSKISLNGFGNIMLAIFPKRLNKGVGCQQISKIAGAIEEKPIIQVKTSAL